jgi:hypothetical protein
MNKGQLVALVQEYLESSETSFVANIDRFIRNAEEDIFRQVQLPDLMQTSTTQFIPGDIFLTLPADFLAPYSVGVWVDGRIEMMLSKDHSFIREVFGGEPQGIPRYYAVYNDSTFMIGPTPDEDYLVEMNYFYEPASLADGSDTDTSWLSINAENALLFGTIIQGYIYLKGDQDVAQQYLAQYETALAALKILAEGRNRKDTYRKANMRIST